MNTAKALPPPATDNPIRITHGGETRYANAGTWQTVCDEMIAKHGPGVPNVTDTSRAPAPNTTRSRRWPRHAKPSRG